MPLRTCHRKVKRHFLSVIIFVYRAQKEEVMRDNVGVVRGFFVALEQGNFPGAMQFGGEEIDWQSPVTRTHP